jgi:hypothetical protein
MKNLTILFSAIFCLSACEGSTHSDDFDEYNQSLNRSAKTTSISTPDSYDTCPAPEDVCRFMEKDDDGCCGKEPEICYAVDCSSDVSVKDFGDLSQRCDPKDNPEIEGCGCFKFCNENGTMGEICALCPEPVEQITSQSKTKAKSEGSDLQPK